MTVEVDWGDARHRITWRSGKLVLDHHRDRAAEEAWIGLGGTRCPCLDVLDLWDAWRQEPLVLLRWADGDEPIVTMPGMGPVGPALMSRTERLDQMRRRHQAMVAQLSGAGPHSPHMTAEQRRHVLSQVEEAHARAWGMAVLACLPPELRDRLTLSTVAGAARRRATAPREWQEWRPSVERALACKAVPALEESIRFWRGRVDAAHRAPAVEAWVTNPGEPVTLFGLVDRAGGWVAASLGADWLTEVWARGLALIDGCFVLAVTGWSEHPARLEVLASRWERRSTEGSTPVIEPAVVVPRGGQPGLWTLRWSA